MKEVKRHCYAKGNVIYKTRTITFKPFVKFEIHNVMKLIQDNLTPDLLSGRKKVMYPDDVNKVKYYGHCYHASQALYYLMNTDQLKGYSAEDYRGEKHWWLQDGDQVFDVTSDQYHSVGQKPPHDRGKVTKWYGWQERPQQISLNLMARVLKNRLIKDKEEKWDI
ncbi:MAG: hypothetical protein CMO46_11855 [Verrucomicrobiales bacterium]|nr:hypothetical protein [Verrucomicrobiales bacterium]|tara:strand:- start:6153 stop:6647 length:495 start_codon:yes stop_codon:yes gene_type:complete